MITHQQLDRAMNYNQYQHLLEELLARGETTGLHQNPNYMAYAQLNLQRMLRLDKTVTLNFELKQTLNTINSNYVWLVLTEGWCGDAAQNLPIIAAIEKHCPHIILRLLLRDEHPDLMDQYLTDGSRSIPKLICVDTKTLGEIFTWGPRPAGAQRLMIELKKNNTPSLEKSLLIQKWYNTDKTKTLQKEFMVLIQTHLK